MKPGIYGDISMEAYQADPCETPSLSSGIANILVTESPLHAWTHHPRLNPLYRSEEDSELDRGAAVHALLLEGKRLFVIDAPDWRTNAAKAARDAARAAGEIPVLTKHASGITDMVDVARKFVASSEFPDLLDGSEHESTMIWGEDYGVYCRARTDILHKPYKIIADYKSTAGSADPAGWSRKIDQMGFDVQGAFYQRGYQRLTGEVARFIWLVQENKPPFACSLIGMSPALADIGEQKVLQALSVWKSCLKENHWPAYTKRVCWAEPMPYDVARWQERMSMDAMAAEGIRK